MKQKATPEENMKRFKELVEDIQFGMLTTKNSLDGTLSSRPMTLQEVDENNYLWFFADKNSHLANDIRLNIDVNVAFAHPSDSSYVSVAGNGYVIQDHQKVDELFTPVTKAWFPDGPNDPNIALIQVRPVTVDFWDSPTSKAVQLYAFAKSIVTGESPSDEVAGHGHVKVVPH